MKIDSKLFSLADIVEQCPHWYFNIPIYQRLYVWGEDQVLILLNDLINAYERGEELFFLGGTLLVEQDAVKGRHFDIIDGQQRFTTLWMLCYAWRGALRPFLLVSEDGAEEPRLRFAIRPEVNRFLERLTFGEALQNLPDENKTRQMRVALDLMHSVFEKRPLPNGVQDLNDHIIGLTTFVFEQVKFVVTTVPRETDLNKLFEVINNRGVQLQHHEILKARMLDAVEEVERNRYAMLWEACADMDSFVERNLAGLMGKAAASAVAECYEINQLAQPDAVHKMLAAAMGGELNHQILSLHDILTETQLASEQATIKDEDFEPTSVRSIFGFPLFLQHSLRIWLLERSKPDLPRLLDKELLSIFDTCFFGDEPNQAESARTFIDLMWKLRVLFDQHIVKWIDQGEEKVHLIRQIRVSTSSGKRYMNRDREPDSLRGFSLLQSMLYHSQEITTQYWLTPLLFFIYRNPNAKSEDYFNYLRHLDNHLLGSEADNLLVERTLSFMQHPWQRRKLIHQTALAKASGTKFAHYWFYKLEFVLWFQNERPSDLWKNFRFTAKTSVEHISPQKPTEVDENRVDKALDHFGNLALVSRSLNSEYGNKPYNEKRQQFINNNKKRIDSLKMELIYKNDRWDDEKAFAHQKQMIDFLDSYCGEQTVQG